MATPSESLPSKRFRKIGPGYLCLGVIYLLGMIALAVTAAAPALTAKDGSPHFLISWLFAPGAWYTGVSVAVLALILAQRVNTISPSPPGRFDPWMAAFLIISSLALSFTSYAACQAGYAPKPDEPFSGNGPFDNVLRPFIDSIALFAFSYYDPFVTDLGHCNYPPPLALLAGRLIAAVAFFSAFVAVLFSLSDRLRDLLTVRRSPLADVAIGVDADSADFLVSIARENSESPNGGLKSTGPLVVLTLVPGRPEIERLRIEGAVVLKMNIDNPSVLQDLLRTTAIDRLYLLSSDATSNIHRFNELVKRVGDQAPERSPLSNAWTKLISSVYWVDDWLAGKRRTKNPGGRNETTFTINNAVVRIDNVWDAEEWRANEIGRGMVNVSVVGLHEGTAQALIRPIRHPEYDVLGQKFNKPDPASKNVVAIWADAQESISATSGTASPLEESTKNFVICGSSQLTLGLLSALSRSAYEEDQLRAALHAYEEDRLREILKKIREKLDSPAEGNDSGQLRTEIDENQRRLEEHIALPARSPGRVTVLLIARDASAIRASFYRRATRRRILTASDAFSHPLTIDVADSDPHVNVVQEALKSIGTSASPRPVVIITDNGPNSDGLLGTLVADLEKGPQAVFEYSKDVWSTVTSEPTGHLQYGINLGAPMGDPGEASKAIETLNDARAIAELSHSNYLLRWVNVTFASEKHDYRREAENLWEKLDQFYKLDNERPVLLMLANLRLIRSNFIENDTDQSAVAHEEFFQHPPKVGLHEQVALSNWRGRDEEPPTTNHTNLTRIIDMLIDSPCQIDGRDLTVEEAEAIFIFLSRSEHSSWLNSRVGTDPPWTLPTITERGIPIPIRQKRVHADEFDAKKGQEKTIWQARAEEFGETVSQEDWTKQVRRKKIEERKKSPEILTWEQLIDPSEQMSRLKDLLDIELQELGIVLDDQRDMITASLELQLKGEVKSPNKVFDQVVSVLHHLDALGYLSVILRKPGT